MNILTSSSMVGPLDKQLKKIDISEQSDMCSWDRIPIQICNSNQGRTTTFNQSLYFYDMIVSNQVFEMVKKDAKSYNTFFDYLLRNLQERIKNDLNPIKQSLENDIYYYYLTDYKTIKKSKKGYKNKKDDKIIRTPG